MFRYVNTSCAYISINTICVLLANTSENNPVSTTTDNETNVLSEGLKNASLQGEA